MTGPQIRHDMLRDGSISIIVISQYILNLKRNDLSKNPYVCVFNKIYTKRAVNKYDY